MASLTLAFSFSYAHATTWAVDFSNAIIKRWPTNIESMTGKIKWEYSNGIILHGIEKVYDHSKNADYLSYIKKWVDSYVNDNGVVTIDSSLHSLDQIQPALLCLFLYKETGTAKYKAGADYILSYLGKQPKTASGGFWHKETYPNQMWTDGIYMAEPFVGKYGYRIGKIDYCDSIATFQPTLLYNKAYNSTSKLLVHAWDETKKAAWADPTTGLSPSIWSRGMGWYFVGMVDVLKYLPKTHPQFSAMLSILGNIAEGIKNAQDPTTGLWYEVTDKPSLTGNFLESSGSGLFIYALKTAIDYGFIDKSYLAVAQKGWTGFKTQLTLDAQGLPVINGFVGAMSAGLSANYISPAASPVSCPPSIAPHGYCAALFAASAMELQTVPKYRISINVVGQGSVSNPTGEMFLDSGSTVTLTAAPASGYHCLWSGDASGTATTAAIVMNAEKNITATFTPGSSIINASEFKADAKNFFTFSPRSGSVSFTIMSAQKINLSVYNCDGCKVKDFESKVFQPGNHTINLELDKMPAGTYLIKVAHGETINSAVITRLE
jgi:unsaturated rhamnogalacturonyl hydrolase